MSEREMKLSNTGYPIRLISWVVMILRAVILLPLVLFAALLDLLQAFYDWADPLLYKLLAFSKSALPTPLEVIQRKRADEIQELQKQKILRELNEGKERMMNDPNFPNFKATNDHH